MSCRKKKIDGISEGSKLYRFSLIRWFVLDNRGVALIVTIMAISIIVALSVQFNRKMRDQLTSTANIDHGLKAIYIAKSGISYALSLLGEDELRVDTLMDSWSNGSDVLKQVSADSRTLFDSGSFELKIEDLSSKIQINQLVDIEDLSKVFKRFLGSDELELDEERINEIVDSTQDWIDRGGEDDDLTRAAGAEDDYYMSLENPYHSKNGPFDSVEELLSVKGMTPELLGTKDDTSKIRPYLTVYGDGKININTADVRVLQSLHEEITQGMAEEMSAYRKDADESVLEKATWYHDSGAGIPEDITIKNSLITTKSTHFRITSTGRYGNVSQGSKNQNESVQRTIVAVVKRPNDDDKGEKSETGFQVLSWISE